MRIKNILTKLAPFGIGLIIALFIYDIYSHGKIIHPGEALYKAQCATCHGDNGEGIKTLIPPLYASDYAAKNIDSIPCWLRFGLNHPIVVHDTVYDQPMYPSTIDEVQIANVINYMNSAFFNSDREVNSSWVRQHWKDCK